MLLRHAQLKSGLFTFFFQELHLGFTGHMKLNLKMNPYYFDSYSKEVSLFSINGAIDCNISRTLVNIKQSSVISWWKAKKKKTQVNQNEANERGNRDSKNGVWVDERFNAL